MSSDARVRWQADGQIRISHDGPCSAPIQHPVVTHRYDLAGALLDVAHCMGQSLAWEIREGGEEGSWLAGYCAR